MNPARRVAFYEKYGGEEAYERARAAIVDAEAAAEVVVETARAKRGIELEIEDREMRLVSEERGLPGNAELSQAAFERHMKVVLNQDTEMRRLRERRLSVASEHERAEATSELARMTVRVESARLEELAGMLRFYAGADSSPTANDT